jgi:hypothetical protein
MKKCTIVTGLLLSLAAGTAMADVDNPRGFYAGAGVGQFNVDIDNAQELGDTVDDLDADDAAFRIFAGYRLTPYLSFEAAYVDFGSPSDEFEASGSRGDYRLELAGFSPAVVGTIPLGPVELFGKLGWYFYDADVRVSLDGGEVIRSDSSGDDFMYGGGIGLTFFERLNTRLEYEVIDIEDTDNANALWASASWRF